VSTTKKRKGWPCQGGKGPTPLLVQHGLNLKGRSKEKVELVLQGLGRAWQPEWPVSWLAIKQKKALKLQETLAMLLPSIAPMICSRLS
jgi:hypothetical protein